jgi:hypothetical protein
MEVAVPPESPQTFLVTTIPISGNQLELAATWQKGPLPIQGTVPGDSSPSLITATAERRASAFHSRVGPILFGDGLAGPGYRFHLWLDKKEMPFSIVDDISVDAAECLVYADPLIQDGHTQSEPSSLLPGLLCLHSVGVNPTDLDVINRLGHTLRDRSGRSIFFGRVNEWLRTISCSSTKAATDRAPFTVTFGLIDSAEGEVPFGSTDSALDEWDEMQQWSWLSASMTLPSVYAPPLGGSDTGIEIALSSSWSARVLRDGAAFVAISRRPDGSPDESLPSLAFYARTIYLDALLLGLLEMEWINRFADRVSESAKSTSLDIDDIGAMDRAITRFRASLWWRAVGQGSHSDRLLAAYQDEHHLPILLDTSKDEIADLVNQMRSEIERDTLTVTRRTEHQVNVLATLFLPTVPILTVWLGVSHSWPGIGVAAGVYALVVGGLVVFSRKWRHGDDRADPRDSILF